MPYKDPEKGRAAHKKQRAAHPERHRASNKRWKVANSEKVKSQRKRYHLSSKYGLTPEAFESLLLGQDGKCASCGTADWGHQNGPVVDHDHTTGKVRGILCHDCNMSEGLLKTPARVQALANYMKRNKE